MKAAVTIVRPSIPILSYHVDFVEERKSQSLAIRSSSGLLGATFINALQRGIQPGSLSPVPWSQVKARLFSSGSFLELLRRELKTQGQYSFFGLALFNHSLPKSNTEW